MFTDKQLLRDFFATRPALQELLKEAVNTERKNQLSATAKTYQMVKTNNAMKKWGQLMGTTTNQ